MLTEFLLEAFWKVDIWCITLKGILEKEILNFIEQLRFWTESGLWCQYWAFMHIGI